MYEILAALRTRGVECVSPAPGVVVFRPSSAAADLIDRARHYKPILMWMCAHRRPSAIHGDTDAVFWFPIAVYERWQLLLSQFCAGTNQVIEQYGRGDHYDEAAQKFLRSLTGALLAPVAPGRNSHIEVRA